MRHRVERERGVSAPNVESNTSVRPYARRTFFDGSARSNSARPNMRDRCGPNHLYADVKAKSQPHAATSSRWWGASCTASTTVYLGKGKGRASAGGCVREITGMSSAPSSTDPKPKGDHRQENNTCSPVLPHRQPATLAIAIARATSCLVPVALDAAPTASSPTRPLPALRSRLRAKASRSRRQPADCSSGIHLTVQPRSVAMASQGLTFASCSPCDSHTLREGGTRGRGGRGQRCQRSQMASAGGIGGDGAGADQRGFGALLL